MPYKRIDLDGDFDFLNVGDGDIQQTVLDGEYGDYQPISHYDTYTGATEATPSEEAQTLYTKDKMVLSNIVIQPIPSNYGLITVVGNHIMVS